LILRYDDKKAWPATNTHGRIFGASITRANSGNGALPTRELEKAKTTKQKAAMRCSVTADCEMAVLARQLY
jgi:hypothetical protein